MQNQELAETFFWRRLEPSFFVISAMLNGDDIHTEITESVHQIQFQLAVLRAKW